MRVFFAACVFLGFVGLSLCAEPQSQGTSLDAAYDLRVNQMVLEASSKLRPVLPTSSVPLFSWKHRTPKVSGTESVGFRVVVSKIPVGLKLSSALGFWNATSYQIWDSGFVTSADTKVNYHGPSLQSKTQYCFAVQWFGSVRGRGKATGPRLSSSVSMPGCFETAPSKADWTAAGSVWVGGANINLIRGSFNLSSADLQATVAARVHVSALGWGRVHLNGEDLAPKDMLGAGWSQYAKRSFFFTYDIRSALTTGENVFAVALGQGWRDQTSFPWKSSKPHHPTHKDELQVEDSPSAGAYTSRALYFMIELQNKSGVWQTVLVSDPALFGTQGPVVTDSVYNGETFDARLHQPGWDLPAFANVSNWAKVQDLSSELWAQTTVLTPSTIPTVQVIKTLTGHVTAELIDTDGTKVIEFDFTENHSGVVEITLPTGTGLAGRTLTFQHAELQMHPPYGTYDPTNKAMLLYYDNLRSAKATDTYIFSGLEQAGTKWHPSFTYHGFRFLVLSGWPANLPDPEVTMLHFRSAVSSQFRLSSSTLFLDSMQAMVAGSQASNLMTVPTDCPQRDERLGWMGDAGLSADSMVLNFDLGTFHRNYLQLIADDQDASGSIPDVVPFMRYGGRPADPSWSAAFVQIVWSHLHYLGDIQPYVEHADEIRAYLDNINQQVVDGGGLAAMSKWGSYGDWVPANPTQKPSNTVTSAANWLTNLRQAAEMAGIAGNVPDQHRYQRKASEVETEIISAFLHFNSQGKAVFENGGQSSTGLALMLDLFRFNSTLDSQVVGDLVTRVSGEDSGKLTVGIIGAKAIFHALVAKGQMATALQLLNGTTGEPSYGYMFSNQNEPATTNLWELWDADTNGPGMNSRNHHMFSSVGTFVRELVGLVGWDSATRFSSVPTLALRVGGCCNALAWANMSQITPAGVVRFAWQVPASAVDTHLGYGSGKEGPFGANVASPKFSIELPVGQRATVRVSASQMRDSTSLITSSGLPAPILDTESNELVFDLAPGTYAL